MEWFKKEDRLPEPGKPIIIYSSAYDNIDEDQLVDDALLFRVIDSQFINIMCEATHWAYLEKPQT